jgi:hypothetical protein
LVFISHDSRDVEIAKAFAELLTEATSGGVGSFVAEGGVPYGEAWFNKILENLNTANELVCLLTPHARERPWVFYEVGVAKGRGLEPRGVVFGGDAGNESNGPLAQYQHCKGDEESLYGFVLQLMQRLRPDLKPHRWVRNSVQVFLQRLNEVQQQQHDMKLREAVPSAATGAMTNQLFEEMRSLARDLPIRLESKLAEVSRGSRITDIHAVDNAATSLKRSARDPIALLVLASVVREELPWLYVLAVETFRDMRGKDAVRAGTALSRFTQCIDVLLEATFLSEMRIGSTQIFGTLEALKSHILELQVEYPAPTDEGDSAQESAEHPAQAAPSLGASPGRTASAEVGE